MATTFGSYKNSSSPYMSWYAEYDYSRTSNSNVAVTVTVHGEILNHSSTSYMGSGNGITVSATVDGTTKTAEIKSSSDVWRGNTNNPRSCSFSFDVSSGTAGQTISVSYSVAGSGYTAPANVPTQSTSFSSPALLYTKSTVFAAGNGQQTINVTITRQSDQMTHSVTYSYGGHSVTHTNVATTDSYQVPNNWVTDRTVAKIDVSCETFLNGTSLGSSYDYGTYNSPADLVPSITQSYQIVNPALEKIMKGISSIKFNSTAQGIDGSTISESYITYGNNSIPLNGSTGILETAGYITFTQFCKDSRGRTATKVLKLPVTDYERPHVTITSLNIVENKIVANVEYSWYNITGNSASIELLYRIDGDSEYTSAYSETLANNNGTLNIQPSAEFSTDQNYEIVVRISDKVSSYDATQEISNIHPIIDVYEDDDGNQFFALGKEAETPNLVDLAHPVAAPSAAFSTALKLGGKDVPTIEAGVWTPVLAGSPTYASRSGSYIKVGNLVWITCDITLSSKGGPTSALTITGLPFQPTANTALAQSFDYATKTPQVAIADSTNFIRLTHDNNGSWSTMTHASISDQFHVLISGCYPI